MKNLPELYRAADGALATAISRGDRKPTCSKGCFHCCKEVVYTSRGAISYLLETLSPDERAALTERTRQWLFGFEASGTREEVRANAFRYRSFKLWCPLLDRTAGTCSVYDRRPMECRLFIASGPVENCANDLKRPFQEFLDAPGLTEWIVTQEVSGLNIGEELALDHVGILLAEALFGYDQPTAARITIRKTESGLDFERMELEEEKV